MAWLAIEVEINGTSRVVMRNTEDGTYSIPAVLNIAQGDEIVGINGTEKVTQVTEDSRGEQSFVATEVSISDEGEDEDDDDEQVSE